VVPSWPKALRVALIGLALGGALAPVATAEAEGPSCPNEQLREDDISTQLPDCRAYELVSPAGPYDVRFNAVSPDGNTVFFASTGALAGLAPESNLGGSAARMFGASRSTKSGWSLSSLTNFAEQAPHSYPFVGASAEGSGVFVTSTTRETPENVLPEQLSLNLYETSNSGPPLLISHDQSGNQLTGNARTGLMGPVLVSADGTHVVFSSGAPLTAVAASGGGGPYVYESDAAGEVSLVSVMSDGALPTPDGGAALGAARPGEQEGRSPAVTNAVSAEGSTVFFNSSEQYDPTAPAGGGTQLFMRRNGSTIDASKGVENATFDGASADGNYVVFSDGSQNIYEFDVTAGTVRPVSSGAGGLNTFLTMSADGSHVYFASNLQLDPAGPPAGGIFLYEWVNGHVAYIATLSQSDLSRLTSTTSPRVTESSTSNQSESQFDQTGTSAHGPLRATADGEYLVFESERPLTADDTNEEAGRLNVYEYTDGGGLARVSRGSLPGSGNGPSDATIGSWQQPPDFESGEGPITDELHPFTFGVDQMEGRVLAEDGSVFFSSREALAEGATDGPLHVYEWREGNTYLISPPGAEATDAHYLENSADGTNVYFSTTQQILRSDSNGGWANIWDARVDGGFSEAPAANPCAQNECPVAVPVAIGPPSSMTFSGPGEAPPSPSTPAASPLAATKPKPLTRAEMLAKALKACRAKRHGKRRRVACESKARQRYGARSKASERGGRGA
jgi:hypothetical protein